MVSVEFIVSQARSIYQYKNLKPEALKCCAHILFNRQCLTKPQCNILHISLYGCCCVLTVYNTGLFEMIVGVLTTSFSRCNPMWFLSMGLRQGTGLCSSSSRKYRGTITANMLETVWNELDYRVDVCRITKGAHIEHL